MKAWISKGPSMWCNIPSHQRMTRLPYCCANWRSPPSETKDKNLHSQIWAGTGYKNKSSCFYQITFFLPLASERISCYFSSASREVGPIPFNFKTTKSVCASRGEVENTNKRRKKKKRSLQSAMRAAGQQAIGPPPYLCGLSSNKCINANWHMQTQMDESISANQPPKVEQSLNF